MMEIDAKRISIQLEEQSIEDVQEVICYRLTFAASLSYTILFECFSNRRHLTMKN